MKVIVERDALAGAISAILNSTARRDLIPILNNVILRPNGARIAMAGTDLDLQFETAVPADITRGGETSEAITVKASILSGIVSQLPNGSQISMEWEDDKAGVTVKSGRSRYKLWTLPATDFPQLRSPQEPTIFSLPGKILAEQLNAVKFAISKEVTRPYLCGVFLQIGNNEHPAFGGTDIPQLEFVATNSHQLGRTAIAVPTGALEMPAVIVPDRAVSEIARLGAKYSDLDVLLAVAHNSLSASAGDRVFTTKLIDMTFPEYLRFVPRESTKMAIVDVDALDAALQRLQQLGDDHRTRAELTTDSLKLSLVNPTTGEASEEIEAEYDGPDLTVGLNGREVGEILGHIRTDACRFEFGTPAEPVLIRAIRGGEADYGCTYLCTLVVATT